MSKSCYCNGETSTSRHHHPDPSEGTRLLQEILTELQQIRQQLEHNQEAPEDYETEKIIKWAGAI